VRLLKDNDYSSQDWQPLNQVIDTIKIKEQGNYSIVLRDLNGNLSGNTSFEIFYLKKPAIDTTNLQHVSRNNGADGSITVSTNGGAEGNKTIQLTGPVNKTADYSGIPIVFNSLVAGIYQLQATDSNECTSEILTFEITQPACEIDITVTPPPAICEGESINLADYVTLTGVNIENFTIYYYKDASFSELVDNSQMVVDESIYYIKAITPDGCEDQDQIEVIVNPLPELTIVNPPPVCTGESINLTASSITNNADLSGLTMTYWTDAEASSELSNPSSVIAEGNYYIKATNNTTNCSDIFAVNISFIELPVLTFVNPAPVCSGEVIVLTAPSANHYSWSTGDTTQSITVSPTITTTYSLTVIENGCESLADSVEITVNELPSVEIMQNKLACEGETVDLTDPEITNYADTTGLTLSYWKGPEPYVELTDPTAVSNTDIYYIKILNENGCSSFDWISVLFNPIPTAKITTSADTINVGDNVELSSNLADSYVWSNGDTLQSITISPVSTETYSLTVTEKGCESLADSVEIYVNLLPWVNSAYVLPMTICGSGSVTYFATPSSGIINWYDTPYGGIPIMPPSEISETTTLYAEAEDEDGRKSAERTPVTAIVNPLPIVPGIPLVENNCGNSDLIFKGSPESDDICWFWQRYAVNTDTSKFSNPYNVTRAGTYYLRALNTSTNCWSESTSKIVTIREKPEVPEIPVVIDYCGISVLSYSVSPHDAYRFWQTSSTGTDFDQHDNPYNVNNYGIYYLRDYNSYSRCWSEASDSVVANPKEPAIITGDSKVCLGTATQLSGSGIPAAIDPWISSSPTVAIVDSTGLVTGVSEGNCDIHYSTSRGCLTTLTLSVHAIPSTPDIPDVEDRCGYSLLNLNTPAENYTGWYWQTSPTDTEFNYSDTVFAPANYYVRGYNGITQCWGNASEAVTATPKIIPTIIEVFTDSRCGPGIVYLSATSTGLINWYKEEVNGAGLSLQTGLNFSPCISSDTVFYISASLNGCRTPKRVPVAATVREIPNLIITPPPVVCAPPYNCDITAPYITAGSTLDLVFTYWLDADTINSLINPYSALPGMYYIKGIDPHTIIDDEPSTGCYTIKPIIW
jgi:hypothetical protein